jgi:hypothetical protein
MRDHEPRRVVLRQQVQFLRALFSHVLITRDQDLGRLLRVSGFASLLGLAVIKIHLC